MVKVIVCAGEFLLATAFVCWATYVVSLGVIEFCRRMRKGKAEPPVSTTPPPAP